MFFITMLLGLICIVVGVIFSQDAADNPMIQVSSAIYVAAHEMAAWTK